MIHDWLIILNQINKKGMKNKDIKGEASDLNQDETVEVIHIKGTPRGEWQAKNINGCYKTVCKKREEADEEICTQT